MAVDKLVDSTKLDNALSYEAARIRLKTGGSANLSFDLTNEKGFGDAIDAITTGSIDINGIAMGTEPSGDLILSTATNIKEDKFKECNNIKSVTAPNVTVIRGGCFKSCTGLESISFDKANAINGTQQFISCTKLKNVNLPMLKSVGGNMFQGCTSLEEIDLPSVTSLGVARVFYGCSNLQRIILRYANAVVPLNSDTLGNTPFAGYNSLTGTLYVPSALVESYKTANNWSTLFNNGTMAIEAIEGSIYE